MWGFNKFKLNSSTGARDRRGGLASLFVHWRCIRLNYLEIMVCERHFLIEFIHSFMHVANPLVFIYTIYFGKHSAWLSLAHKFMCDAILNHVENEINSDMNLISPSGTPYIRSWINTIVLSSHSGIACFQSYSCTHPKICARPKCIRFWFGRNVRIDSWLSASHMSVCTVADRRFMQRLNSRLQFDSFHRNGKMLSNGFV